MKTPTFTIFPPNETATIGKIAQLKVCRLPTFPGGLWEKIRTRTGFNKIPANYISEESLINGVYDKSIV